MIFKDYVKNCRVESFFKNPPLISLALKKEVVKMRKENAYKKLIKRAKGKIRSARIPRTLSKKNNSVFNNEEQIICYTLMQKEKKHYRDMPDFLELLEKEIGLKRIPHFTTINKFILKAKPI